MVRQTILDVPWNPRDRDRAARIDANFTELYAETGIASAPTYAAARLVSGVSTGDRLQVLGRTALSDGGQGLFTWVAGGSTTINDGSQLSAPGGIWQRPDTTIQAQWYGIDPTGAVACDVALNLAIQDAIIQKKKLIIPSGIFLLNAPLMCFKAGATFAKIDIE